MRRNYIFILCAAFIATLPLIAHGPSCGHDFDFHLQSWLDVAEQFRHGTLLPHWAFSAAYNAGEPRFVFYPPLSWMLGAALTLIFPIALALTIYTFIALAAAGLAMHRLARHFASPNAALLAATLYIVNPYMLFNAFERTAYAELLAAAWLPLLFLAVFRERPTIRGIALPIALLWLTNAPAAVMGCYALALVIVIRLVTNFMASTKRGIRRALRVPSAPSALKFSLTPSLNSQSKYSLRLPSVPCPYFRTWVSTQPIKLATTSLAGTALGLTLPAFYLIPAAYERRFVQIAMAIIPNMRFQDNFLFGHTADAPHNAVLLTASLIAVTLLIATIAALTALFLTSHLSSRPNIALPSPPDTSHLSSRPKARTLRRSGETCGPPPDTSHLSSRPNAALPSPPTTSNLSSRPKARTLRRSGETCSPPATTFCLAILTLCIAFLLTPPATFLWNHLPELAFLQFPWRLLSLLAVVLALAIALLLDRTRIRNSVTIFLSASLAVALTFPGIHNFRQPCDDEDLPSARAQLFRVHHGIEPTDEYTPNQADNDVLRTNDPPFWLSTNAAAFAPNTTPNPATQIDAPQNTEASPSGTNQPTFAPETFTVSAPTPEFLILNLRLFPDWHILVNDREPAVYTGDMRDDGLTVVPIAAGASTIQIAWHRSLDQQLGLAVSAIAACIYAGLFFGGTRLFGGSRLFGRRRLFGGSRGLQAPEFDPRQNGL
ncbi:MAG: 6-pyruvoyl-tetrahydropterin synthase-related protein [Acidobacteriota bacterium]|nr:6-pyruvoyl-tetrahydropterin synthase-related protein [Acidobacteriota bacterium]